MEHKHDASERPLSASLKATYRALLARGLEAGEAANLTAFLHGLPSAGFTWSLAEIDSIIQRRINHAAEVRAAVAPARASAGPRRTPRPTAATRRASRAGTTKVVDPPRP